MIDHLELKLLRNMRNDHNIALASESWNDSSQIQQAIILLLESTAREDPEGMSLCVVDVI